jgi:hypothetical protein
LSAAKFLEELYTIKSGNVRRKMSLADIAYLMRAADNFLGNPIKFYAAFIGVYRRFHEI